MLFLKLVFFPPFFSRGLGGELMRPAGMLLDIECSIYKYNLEKKYYVLRLYNINLASPDSLNIFANFSLISIALP